jgi:hypothetical protein
MVLSDITSPLRMLSARIAAERSNDLFKPQTSNTWLTDILTPTPLPET